LSGLAGLERVLAEQGQAPLTPEQLAAFEKYLELLLRWNARVNLSAIRDEDGILRRHFAESIACARKLPAGLGTLLDFGSGAGLPGIPCGICRPELRVTLAESQGKKAAFLGEVLRTLGLAGEIWGARVETMEPGCVFDAVTLRAVDRMGEATQLALGRVREGGWLCLMTTLREVGGLAGSLAGVAWRAPEALAGTEQQVLLMGRKLRST
jgi:16S rRNA (guanine527-N7)-methyltransferase